MGLSRFLTGKWYAEGLRFECTGCGACCAGPQEGYIWLTKKEMHRAAEYLKMPPGVFQKKYVRRVGFRWSLIEHPKTKDCIFLTEFGTGKRGCAIYPVRPLQCRTWPFWTENLRTIQAWEAAAGKCPGINRGTFWSFEQIESQRTQKPDPDGDS